MTNSMEYASPSVSLDKGNHSRSSLMYSPSLWSALQSRFGTLLDQLNAEEMERTRRLKEEAKLLSKGFNTTSSSLSATVQNGLQAYATVEGGRDLTRLPSLTELVHVSVTFERSKTDNDVEVDKRGSKRKLDFSDKGVDNSPKAAPDVLKKSKKAKIAATSKVGEEVKSSSIRSDLGFMKERCAELEEENSRLKNGLSSSKGIIQVEEEDDLVRLQVEVLLAEKSRLAYENGKLARENQWLHQLVEYHKKMITSLEQGTRPSFALTMSL